MRTLGIFKTLVGVGAVILAGSPLLFGGSSPFHPATHSVFLSSRLAADEDDGREEAERKADRLAPAAPDYVPVLSVACKPVLRTGQPIIISVKMAYLVPAATRVKIRISEVRKGGGLRKDHSTEVTVDAVHDSVTFKLGVQPPVGSYVIEAYQRDDPAIIAHKVASLRIVHPPSTGPGVEGRDRRRDGIYLPIFSFKVPVDPSSGGAHGLRLPNNPDFLVALPDGTNSGDDTEYQRDGHYMIQFSLQMKDQSGAYQDYRTPVNADFGLNTSNTFSNLFPGLPNGAFKAKAVRVEPNTGSGPLYWEFTVP